MTVIKNKQSLTLWIAQTMLKESKNNMTTATLQLSTLLLLFTTLFVDTSRAEDRQTIFLQLRNGTPRSVSFAQVASNETVRAKTLENLSSYERYIMLGTAGTNLMAGWIYRMLLFKNIWQNDVRRPINLQTGTSPKNNSSIHNQLPNSDRKRLWGSYVLQYQRYPTT